MQPRFHLRSLMVLILLAALVMGVVVAIGRIEVWDRTDVNHLAILLGAVLVLALSKIRSAFALRRRQHRPPDLEVLDADPIRPRTGD